MIFPRVAIYLQMIKYFSHEEALALLIEAVRIGVEPDRRRLHMATKIPFIRPFILHNFSQNDW